MASDDMDYALFLKESVDAKNTFERAESLDKFHIAVKNYQTNPNRCINSEIEHFKILVKDTSLSIQLKILNCLLDYVKHTNLDDESLLKFYYAVHEELFGNILYQIKAYDICFQFICSIIDKHTSKKYIIKSILNQFSISLESEIKKFSNVDKIIPYCVLLEQIISKYGACTLIPKFISLLSSIDYKDNKFKQYIEDITKKLKSYYYKKPLDECEDSNKQLSISQETNYTDKSQVSLVGNEGNLGSMLKNFQFAISHPNNIDSNYDFTRSIDVILSILKREDSDVKLLVLCYETIEKLAYVKLDNRNQFKLFNYLIADIESKSDDELRSSILNCLCRVISNYNIRIFREFLKIVYEHKLSDSATISIINALIEHAPQNAFERNKLLFESIEDFIKLATKNDRFEHITRLSNNLRNLLKTKDTFYDITRNFSPKSGLANSLSLSDLVNEPPNLSTSQPLSQSQLQITANRSVESNTAKRSFEYECTDKKFSAIHQDIPLDIDNFNKGGPRPLLINVVDKIAINDSNMCSLSSILELKSKFVCKVSHDLFNCMFDIENTQYEKMSLEACKFWANYIQQDNKYVRSLIFTQENLFHPILVWFYRTLCHRNSLDVAMASIIFIVSGVASISKIKCDRKMLQDEILYILKIIFYILNKEILNINKILDGGLPRILLSCISNAENFPSFFTPFYTTLSDLNINVSISILNCFENIIFSENSVIGRNEIQYMFDVQSQIVPISKDFKLVEETNKLYKKLSPLTTTPNKAMDIECERMTTHLATNTMSCDEAISTEHKLFQCDIGITHDLPHAHTNRDLDAMKDTVEDIICKYKSSLDEYLMLSLAVQNYSIDNIGCASSFNGLDARYLNNDTESILATCDFKTLVSDSLELTKSLEPTLRSIKSSCGLSVYHTLQDMLQNISSNMRYEFDYSARYINLKLDSCVSINHSIQMIYHNLLGKKQTSPPSNLLYNRPSLQTDSIVSGGSSSNLREKRQVDISEFVPILKNLSMNLDALQRTDFRSMQLLMRMYIYLKYRLTSTNKVDTWDFIASNMTNWPIETIFLSICCLLRDISHAYSVNIGERRYKHPLDTFRIDVLRQICANYVSKSKLSFTQPKNFIYQLKFSLMIVKYDLMKAKDTDSDVDDILKIIHYLDTSIGFDIDTMSKHAFELYGINKRPSRHSLNITATSPALEVINYNNKIDAINSFIKKLHLCNA